MCRIKYMNKNYSIVKSTKETISFFKKIMKALVNPITILLFSTFIMNNFLNMIDKWKEVPDYELTLNPMFSNFSLVWVSKLFVYLFVFSGFYFLVILIPFFKKAWKLSNPLVRVAAIVGLVLLITCLIFLYIWILTAYEVNGASIRDSVLG